MKFMGHVYRKNGLDHLGMPGNIRRRKSRERQWLNHRDSWRAEESRSQTKPLKVHVQVLILSILRSKLNPSVISYSRDWSKRG